MQARGLGIFRNILQVKISYLQSFFKFQTSSCSLVFFLTLIRFGYRRTASETGKLSVLIMKRSSFQVFQLIMMRFLCTNTDGQQN